MTDNKLAEVEAAVNADWTQVVLNGGPPCFYLDQANGRFCLRAERWEGHAEDGLHNFVALPDFISRLLDATHADALMAAAELCEKFENEHYGKFNESLNDLDDESPAVEDEEHGLYMAAKELKAQILALIPERARLERELEVARARLDGSKHVGDLRLINDVADLEAKLKAMEGK